MSIISAPRANEKLDGPRLGQSIVCSGKWVEIIDVENPHSGVGRTITSPMGNQRLTIVLRQPNVAQQSRTDVTDLTGKWVTNFASCQPGPATVVVSDAGGDVLESVAFSVNPNQRQQIAVTLDNMQDAAPAVAALDARIRIPTGGARITVTAAISSPTRSIDVRSSLDNYANVVQLVAAGSGIWTGAISVAGSEAPSRPVLLVRDRDFFGVETETDYSFWLDDVTPPSIAVEEPTEDQELYVAAGQSKLDVWIRGSVHDGDQSGYKPGSLTYTFNGAANNVEPEAAGDFAFMVSANLGPNRVTLTAEDNSGNRTPFVAREFNVASNYRVKTLDELLSRRSYLGDLIRFATSHVLDSLGQEISTSLLSASFMPPSNADIGDFFGSLADPGSKLGDRVVNELLPAVNVLRSQPRGLLVYFRFENEQGQETPDSGPLRLHAVLSKPGMIGAPGSPTAGTLELDVNTRATSSDAVTSLLSSLGKDNDDFSVSFWIYESTGPSGDWRGVLYKGHDGPEFSTADSNRTFGIWLQPGSNQLHYRIGTVNDPNEGGNSIAALRIQRWTHVCYVKRADYVELYIDGARDSSARLSGNVVANDDALLMGATPSHPGFRGALDELRIYGFALSAADVAQLAAERTGSTTPPIALQAYVRAAYEALLVAHGTSYEELRAPPAKGTSERRTIAERLGLTAPNASDDGLENLLAPQLPDNSVEAWLGATFGLPSTATLLPSLGGASQDSRSWILAARRDYLARRWQAEDAEQRSVARPWLDPDLIERADLDLSHSSAPALLEQRRLQLESRWAELRAAIDVQAKLALVYTAEELTELATLEQLDASGAPILEMLAALGLQMATFRRVRFYQQLQQPLSQREQDDIAHLLIGSWKTRELYDKWLAEERALLQPLWPDSLNTGAFVADNFKRDFPPWRATASDRTSFESLVSGRMRAFDALAVSHERATLDAQRTALPLFRDCLLAIAELRSTNDALDLMSEHLLLDVAAAGALTRTLVDQATLILQSLIAGIRLGRFEAGHPAAAWSLRTTWLEEPMTDASLNDFDQEWSLLGSYESWRFAKRFYLYPETALYPELRTKATTPYKMTDAFGTFLKELRRLGPSEPTDVWMTEHASSLTESYEREFFVPVAIGALLERSSSYARALDWYRKVYETRNSPETRAKVSVLIEERGKNKPPLVRYDTRWTLSVDPHTNAKTKETVQGQLQDRFGNPYTRFVLMRITRCLSALADIEFSQGTDEARARALALYLEARQILNFSELTDPQPVDASQAYLPNPSFTALRDHVSVSLSKLRRGLSYLGTPAQLELARDSDGVSMLLRPTPYRFKVLVERAKQLLTVTQNLEAQYLAALEKRDAVDEQYRREAASAQIAAETVNLRALQQNEASDGVALVSAQRLRSQIQRDRYASWIAAGPNQHERAQIGAMNEAATARQVANVADTVYAGAQAVQSMGGIVDIITSGGSKAAMAGVMVGAVATRGVAQGFVIAKDAQAGLEGIAAGQERREQDWALQRDLANQDLLIAQEQIDLATNRRAIADTEYSIAKMQRDQTQDMLRFLSSKFANTEFYEWMIGALADVYAVLLRTATTVASQAEGQLAFERQQTPGGLIKQDYWNYVTEESAKSFQPAAGTIGTVSPPDRRGITASAQLLRDLTALDQYAFDTEKRLLNLTQSFSLANTYPLEFAEFRRSGVLSFATTGRQFDEGFPGHFMRLIKRVRVSAVALIPPNQGIRATLNTNGLSRVVTGDPSFPLLVIRQEPQSIALTTMIAGTGVFELDAQSDLLNPFEGLGVETNWTLELPLAGNPFDFGTLTDVVISVDYTALSSWELRDRVVKQLPRRVSGTRAYSVRRDLPDAWYDLGNSVTGIPKFTLGLARSDFPPNLAELAVEELAICVTLNDGATATFAVRPSFSLAGGSVVEGAAAPCVQGLVSSRQSAAASWHASLFSSAHRTGSAARVWILEFLDPDDDGFSLNEALQSGRVSDIVVAFTFSGLRPVWHS